MIIATATPAPIIRMRRARPRAARVAGDSVGIPLTLRASVRTRGDASFVTEMENSEAPCPSAVADGTAAGGVTGAAASPQQAALASADSAAVCYRCVGSRAIM